MVNGPSTVRAVPHNSRLQATRVKPRAPEPERYRRSQVRFLANCSTFMSAIISERHSLFANPAPGWARPWSPLRGARAEETRTGFRRGLSNHTGVAIGRVCTRRWRMKASSQCVSSAAAVLVEQRRGYRCGPSGEGNAAAPNQGGEGRGQAGAKLAGIPGIATAALRGRLAMTGAVLRGRLAMTS